MEQPRAEMLLQLRNLAGDRGLAEHCSPARRQKTSRFRHPDEGTKAPIKSIRFHRIYAEMIIQKAGLFTFCQEVYFPAIARRDSKTDLPVSDGLLAWRLLPGGAIHKERETMKTMFLPRPQCSALPPVRHYADEGEGPVAIHVH